MSDRSGELSPHEVVRASLEAGIDAAHPRTVIEEHVGLDDGTLSVGDTTYDLDDVDDIVVIGGGNAAGAVAAALESMLDEHITEGVVVTDVTRPTETIDVLRGDHPVPSERGVSNTRRMFDAAAEAAEDDLIIAIVGGGGSALMAAPADGVALSELQSVTEALIDSGATIDEINAVRKHLSDVKGGQLARIGAPAPVVGIVFSDVVGNDLDVIASGPTAPDPTDYETALLVLERYNIPTPDAVSRRLENGKDGSHPETPRLDDGTFDRVDNHVLADSLTALTAAAEETSERGYEPIILSSQVRGEAREAAKTHVAIAEECLVSGNPVDPPVAFLSGGETTVEVRGDGTGGPNLEFALSAAVELDEQGVVVASIDTDGHDGSTDSAGAIVDSETVPDPDGGIEALNRNDAYPFLDEHDALFRTGETGTNVNDLRILVVDGR